MKDLNKKAKAYALKNALAHDGKAITGAVISGLFAEGLKKSNMAKYFKEINEIVNQVNTLSLDEQKKEFGKIKDDVHERKTREGLAELPDVPKKGVIMRFSPSPSGPLHVGHALTASLSFLYVKKYKGRFYVRIEDTNPENIYKPAYNMIKKESEWIFQKKAKFIIQSERMFLYYRYAEKLLRKNKAYVCTCSGDEFREYVSDKKNCPCRDLPKKEHYSRWEKMLAKDGFKEGGAVLRFKSDMQNKNPAMRDFPLARICLTEHPLQKKRFRVWPLMNFAVAVDDIELKMTHIIRAKEHRDNAQRQKMIYDVLGKKFPWTGFLGRIHFKDFELSTTKMRHAIEEGKYKGWDDLRLPTIASLKKQGFKPEAFWKMAEQRGLSEVDKIFDKKDFFELLNRFNED